MLQDNWSHKLRVQLIIFSRSAVHIVRKTSKTKIPLVEGNPKHEGYNIAFIEMECNSS